MLRAIALCLLAWVGEAAYVPRLPPHRSSPRRAAAFATVAAEPAAPTDSVYSPTARANLRHAVVTEPLDEADGETAPDRSQRWKYRLTGLVFAAIKRTPLYGKIKRKALEKMVASAESTGLKWDLSVRELNEAGATAQTRLDAIIAEAGPGFEVPEYFVRPFHAYDGGNLCWEHATEQSLASAAVGTRNLPGVPPAEGEDRFRGAYERELLDLLPPSAPARRDGASLLDLGCGVGISTHRLLRAFPRAGSCIGLDLSAHMLSIGRYLLERDGHTDPRLSLRLGDAASTGLADGSVDLAAICLVMHELPAKATDEILAEVPRRADPLTRARARLRIPALSASGLARARSRWPPRHLRDGPHLARLRARSLVAMDLHRAPLDRAVPRE